MRGESTRVAARVRDLLSEHGDRTGAVVADDDDPPLRPASHRPGWRQRLQARIPVRLDPGRRAVVAVGAAVLVAAVLTGLWVVAERPRALAVGPTGVAGASSPVPTGPLSASAGSSGRVPAGASSAAPATPTAPAIVVVDVAGKVRRPGLYRLPVGARVDDAVRAAGGALAGVNLSSLNLAAKVVDGQQIPVGIAGSARGAAAGAAVVAGSDGSPGGGGGMAGNGAPGPGAGEPVDLNTATIEQLETLPGVGPVLAQHVLDWRTAHGHFATVDQLNDVPGIGEVKFAALKSLVTV
ncbi:MAG: helix-hairpin-helix domain-containing protein [Jatrophihabitans sp.]|uniref:helix-hairpin-helix domain-containing protein n=1 Tax=Jatrophihabitans sp. TaxID=1932789 RepID=UPI0039127895